MIARALILRSAVTLTFGGATPVLAQAAAEDEISFDPNDIITNIEMVSYEVSSVVNLRPQELHVSLSS